MSLLKALFDRHSYKILLSIIDESKTAVQICNENEKVIPISSTYKKIKKLKEAGLLIIDKIVINKDGKNDVVIKSGWWQSPVDVKQIDWQFHPADLGEDHQQHRECQKQRADIDGERVIHEHPRENFHPRHGCRIVRLIRR